MIQCSHKWGFSLVPVSFSFFLHRCFYLFLLFISFDFLCHPPPCSLFLSASAPLFTSVCVLLHPALLSPLPVFSSHHPVPFSHSTRLLCVPYLSSLYSTLFSSSLSSCRHHRLVFLSALSPTLATPVLLLSLLFSWSHLSFFCRHRHLCFNSLNSFFLRLFFFHVFFIIPGF